MFCAFPVLPEGYASEIKIKTTGEDAAKQDPPSGGAPAVDPDADAAAPSKADDTKEAEKSPDQLTLDLFRQVFYI